jgi:hypothetical protein
MNASEVKSRLLVSLSYRPEIRTQRATSSILSHALLSICVFLHFCPKMNVKFSVELQTRPHCLKSGRGVRHPQSQRTLYHFMAPTEAWEKVCRACTGNTISHPPPKKKRPTVATSKICKLFLLRECVYN